MANDPKVAALHAMLDRADKLKNELQSIYNRDLAAKVVSDEALVITHQIVELCSNVLDSGMFLFVELKIALTIPNIKQNQIYFPAGTDENAYKSALGKWGGANLSQSVPDADKTLRSLQPFVSIENVVFAKIKSFAAHKHRGLRPQIRIDRSRTHVSRPGGSGVSWSNGVTFSGGVSVMGVPMDPNTQLPIHSDGIDVTVERWASFLIEGTGDDASAFCSAAIAASRRAIDILHPPMTYFRFGFARGQF